MTTQTSFIAQPHVRPVLLGWSRWLVAGVLILLGSAILAAGCVAVATALMHSFVLALLVVISLGMVGVSVFLPQWLPQMPSPNQG